MELELSRRIGIHVDQLSDDDVLGQLFATCAAYGTVEDVVCERNHYYNSSDVAVQFQRFSSAEQFQRDAHQRRGQSWRVRFEPAAPHTGSEALVSSTQPFSEEVLGLFGCSASEKGDETPSFRECVRGVKNVHFSTSALSGTGESPTDTHSFVGVLRAVDEVARHCIGRYVGILGFRDAHTCHAFLTQNQHILAKDKHVFAVHVGSASGVLGSAVKKLLTCQPLSTLQEGAMLRAYVVSISSSKTSCTVDAGVVTATTTDGGERTVIPIDTATNFLKVVAGDEVMVQITHVLPATSGKLPHVTGSLQHVVVNTPAPTKAGSSHKQKRGGRGGGTSPTLRAGAPAGAAAAVLASLGRGGARSNAGAAGGRGRAQESLASKVFRAIQEKKHQQGMPHGAIAADAVPDAKTSTGSSHPDDTRGHRHRLERLSMFPSGTHVYSRLVIQIERVGSDGFHAIALSVLSDEDAPHALGSSDAPRAVTVSFPVLVPISLVPPEEGQKWSEFAVAGEKMTVALLYAVAVAGSSATLLGIASKLDADLRLTKTIPAMVTRSGSGLMEPPGTEESESEPVVTSLVGCGVKGVRMLELSPRDIGVDPSNTHFPATIVQSSITGRDNAPVFTTLPVVVPLKALDATGTTLAATSRADAAAEVLDLVISEVVNDVKRGHYAVAIPRESFEAAAAARQQNAAALKERRRDDVRRALAAAIAKTSARSSNTSTDSLMASKKARTEF